MSDDSKKEGGLAPPTRHTIDWRDDDYYDVEDLKKELKRVFDVCHGCRRCFNLCNAFPRLFDAIDESDTFDVDGLTERDFEEVIDDCYLCDRCYMSKCPYVPPHPFNIDFPHLMLRAKAIKNKNKSPSIRDRLLSETTKVGTLAGIPVVTESVNALLKSKPVRHLLDKGMGVHKEAKLPTYEKSSAFKQWHKSLDKETSAHPTKRTTGKAYIFHTCYGKHNQITLLEDLTVILNINGIQVDSGGKQSCCGMVKMERGDFLAIEKLMLENKKSLMDALNKGYDILSPIPSCTLMMRSEWPLLFPEEKWLKTLQKRCFDPFEYLNIRRLDGHFHQEFKKSLGRVAYHIPCHSTALNMGQPTKLILEQIPDTSVYLTDKCSGHNGTYGVKKETHKLSKKIGKPVFKHCNQADTSHYGSDCPIAGLHIESSLDEDKKATHPISMLRQAYGL